MAPPAVELCNALLPLVRKFGSARDVSKFARNQFWQPEGLVVAVGARTSDHMPTTGPDPSKCGPKRDYPYLMQLIHHEGRRDRWFLGFRFIVSRGSTRLSIGWDDEGTFHVDEYEEGKRIEGLWEMIRRLTP